jgi:hypothetical protein
LGSFGNPVEDLQDRSQGRKGTKVAVRPVHIFGGGGLATDLKKNDSVLHSVAFVTFGVKAATV